MWHEFPRPHWSKATGQRDRALPVHVQILQIFSEGGEGPAFRPGWVQIKTVENRSGSGPPLPTPSGSAHDVGDNISTIGTASSNQDLIRRIGRSNDNQCYGKKKSMRNIAICRVHMHNLHLGANLLPGANLHSDTNLHPLASRSYVHM